MRIAIVCFNLFVAGGARLVFNSAHALKKRGHHVVIYTPSIDIKKYGNIADSLDIKIVELKNPISWFTSGKPRNFFTWILRKLKHEHERIAASRAIAKAISEDGEFDIINVHDSAYRVPYFVKGNKGACIIWTVNGPPVCYIPRNKFFHDIIGNLYQFFYHILDRKYRRIIHRIAVLAYRDRSWFPDDEFHKIMVIRPGNNFETFYAPVKDITHKSKNKTVRLMALGALTPFRRFEDIIYAASLLREWGYDVRADIVCNNIWNADEYRDNLKILINQRNLKDHVYLWTFGKTEFELKKLYEESDIFIQPVYVPPPGDHGWGLVNFEAMSAGLPVILCRSSTATEILEDNNNVLLVDPLSPPQIADAVTRLIDDPSLYKKIAEAGQQFTKENLSWEKYALNFDSLHKNCQCTH